VVIQTPTSSGSTSPSVADAGTVALTTRRRGSRSITPLEGALHVEHADEWPARWFVLTLAVLALLGIGLRIGFAVAWEDGTTLVGDPKFFQQAAASLSQGHGYAVPFLGKGQPVPTALHPPAFPGILALFDFVKLQSDSAHRIALAFISAVSVVVMGLLGRRLMSSGAGLVAAAFAAFSPLWVQWGGRLLSESVYLVVIPLLLWVALETVDRPSWWIFGVVGLVIGVAALTRSEAIAFTVVLGVPLILLGSRDWRKRATYAMVLVAGVVIIVGPWLVRNEIQLGGFTLSTDNGTTWAGAYTPATFSPANPLYGSVDNETQFADTAVFLKEGTPPDGAKAWTERPLEDAVGNVGMTFARRHLSDLPGVVLAREGRLWGVYSIGTQLHNDDVDGFYIAGWFFEWISLPLAVAGAVILGKRSRRHLVVIVTPVIIAAINAALFIGSTRLRAVAEPSIFLLASIAIVSAFSRLGRSTLRGTGGAASNALRDEPGSEVATMGADRAEAGAAGLGG
jgi:4-amino-4-deoxy-L-arabinose transferase-like glycosyltransferase